MLRSGNSCSLPVFPIPTRDASRNTSMLNRVLDQHHPSLPAPQTSLASALLANFEGMVYRCRVDSNWTPEFLSAGCERLTGYQVADFLERGLITLDELIHADDRAAVRAAVDAALRGDGRFSIEYRIVRRDGALRWVWEHGTAFRDERGGYLALQGFMQDVTRHHEYQRALHDAERRFRSIFENAVEGIYQSTRNGYLAVNPALARMYGYASPQALIDGILDIAGQLYVVPGRRDEFVRALHQHGAVVNFESEVRRRDGALIWISENARAVHDEAGRLLYFEGTVVDITERRDYETRIRHQATHDALTGLPNRSLLHDRLQQAIFAARRGTETVAVAFIDLDQFKIVNDSLGHMAGDELLKAVTARLLGSVRACDTVSRQGGDEFVLVFAGCISLSEITAAIERVIAAVGAPLVLGGLELQVTCSIGISLFPEHGASAEELLRNADAAMYRAKEAGRNSHVFFDPSARQQANERLALLNSMRHALSHDEFLLHFQPRISLGDGGVIGAEALIRWQHPQRGMVPPAEFIPLAEDSGLVLAIGEWVLRRACAQNVAWQQAGLLPLPVSVNLSPRQLVQDGLVEMVAAVLEETGLAPRYLELEITETVVMRHVEQSLATLAGLKQLGIAISIDDFGTGYSSLNYLKRFPVDTLKIDRSFVADVAHDHDDAAIVKAVISLGHILQMRVLAEGVETEAQRRFLMDNGCDQAQGYLFAAPLPGEEFARRYLLRGD